ncbi:hypothetical protein B1R32_10652 [Abditibacterium utsteinense]|uniref:Uncharacterized protein n=1 Tax=Abditibacterium utsteinense TaxID=1960156 RepID=A0A2S8STV5_9BACT|nr:glycoside hydrolase family 127 protein [Abditibacterium utsteinense]PQV64208.1 hypothetical protein B1R32_10652 [Abditibacterium utsteinense]
MKSLFLFSSLSLLPLGGCVSAATSIASGASVPQTSTSQASSLRKSTSKLAPLSLPVDQISPRIAPRLQPFSLRDVRLLNGPFQHAQQLDLQYLLFLQPDRFLHNFRKNAGLKPKAPIYGGWESQGVAGQTLGHYLSALAMMFQATGDARLKQKLDYTLSEIALCQAQSSDGYVAGIPDGRAMFADIRAGRGNGALRGWVPWYTMHKLFAGLRDAYFLTGSETAKSSLLKLSDWAVATTAKLDDAQWQIMLGQEHGGMNEVLADVYALTGEKKYLDLARHFSHRLVLDPLSEKRDTLSGLHANTQIPKIVGFERIYQLTGDKKYGDAAQFFWETVTKNRSYAIGGNSDHEHFFEPSQTSAHLSAETAENCNVYNMLKLTRGLNEIAPSEAHLAYYERALFNQILSSQDPVKGGFNYLNSLQPGGFKVYSNPETAFWCCVGTGLENHSKYGDSIYFHDKNSLYVNLFIASRLNWREKGVTITQNTRFPDSGTTQFVISAPKPARFALKLRQPNWTKGAKLSINGKNQPVIGQPGSYETIAREWKNGDTVSWQLPMSLHSEALHNSPAQRAILYGPIVLAGDMGRQGLDKISDYVDGQTVYSNLAAPAVPVLVSTANWQKTNDWARNIQRISGSNLAFEARGMAKNEAGQSTKVRLIPFSRAHHIRYNTYWNIYSPQEWQQQREQIAARDAAKRELMARTVDELRPNEQQSEQDHALKSENSQAGDFGATKWRDASDGGFFEFELQTAPLKNELSVTYWGDDNGNRNFDVLVDGQKIATQRLENNRPGEFFDVVTPIPAALTQGKKRVTVRFQAHPGQRAGGVFGARILRAEK